MRRHAPSRGARRTEAGIALGGGVSGASACAAVRPLALNERMPTAGLVTFTLLRSASSDRAGRTLGSAPDSTGSLVAITTWGAMKLSGPGVGGCAAGVSGQCRGCTLYRLREHDQRRARQHRRREHGISHAHEKAQGSHDGDEDPVPPNDLARPRRFSACPLIWPPPESSAPHPAWRRMRANIWLPGNRQPHPASRRRGARWGAGCPRAQTLAFPDPAHTDHGRSGDRAAQPSRVIAAARDGASRSRCDMAATGSGQGMASSGSSNAIATSSAGSCARSIR